MTGAQGAIFSFASILGPILGGLHITTIWHIHQVLILHRRRNLSEDYLEMDLLPQRAHRGYRRNVGLDNLAILNST